MEEKKGPEKYTIEHLNKLYNESETCDRDVFAEMRTNILTIAGQHYKRISNGLDRNLRRAGVDRKKRLRLVKNHTAKAMSDVKDILASMSPAVMPVPLNDNEPSHIKVAELATNAWNYGKEKLNFDSLKDELLNSHVHVGEVATKVFFNPIAGKFKGYAQKLNEFGQPLYLDQEGNETPEQYVMDEFGNPISENEMAPDKMAPEFSGAPVIEKIEAYNLLRAKSAKSISSSPYLIVRKMVSTDEAKQLIKQADFDDKEKEEKLELLQKTGETTFKVFNGTTGEFQDSEDEILFKEYYFRQCPEFPRGYYFITVDGGILFEGELPFGEEGEIAYPIKHARFEIYESSSRGFSLIKRLRPSQAEINRCSSSISETQLRHGRTKVIVQRGSKFSQGTTAADVDVFYSTDGNPTVVKGEGGDQFLGYLEMNVEELYRLAKIPENSNPLSQNFDPRAELFKTQKQKARFTEPASRFAKFLKDNCESYLFLVQKYAQDMDIEEVFGKSAVPDVEEFIGAKSLPCKVKLAEVSEDIDSELAKTLELDTILQYAGNDLDPDTKKIILSQYPVISKTSAFKHITLDLKNIESDILALDRGEYRPAHKSDDHGAYIKHLNSRTKQKDFYLLTPEIRSLYEKKINEHEEIAAMLKREEEQASAGFIPSGGALVKAELYVNPDPSNPNKRERAVFPTEALMWLEKKLKSQGSPQNLMQQMAIPQDAATDIAQRIIGGDQAPPMGEGMMLPQIPQ